MDISWTTIITGILAGGLAGQITVSVLNSRFSNKKEYRNWLRSERYKVFSEYLEQASVVLPKDKNEYPDCIRILSQKVHLLCNGTAPKIISDSMQRLFILALDYKLGRINDEKKWRDKRREETRILRKEFSILLKE